MNTLKVFSGSANRPLAEAIARHLGKSLCSATTARFPDDEMIVKINEDVRGHDIFIIQPTCRPQNDNLMELLLYIDAAYRASAERITAVIPYYGYARQDRKDEGRVPISAKLVANMLQAAGASRVLAVHLHAHQIQGFFDIPVDHLLPEPVFTDYYKSLGLEDLTVVSPDVGNVKMARVYAEHLDGKLAIIDKERLGGREVRAAALIGTVEGRNVLIVDDMITSGGTIRRAADLVKECGARDVYVAATHPVFCPGAVENLATSPAKEVAVADTIPLTPEAADLKNLRQLSLAPLLGEAIKRIHKHESVSELFLRKTKSKA
ncbi:MAG: ribose-phosphate pyrophosphokinase [Planctomycetes bacterium DG_20]|nr:MAG: ribose-phosphate pyrophosphokinase [Planctomycetes bacterium DG_20]